MVVETEEIWPLINILNEVCHGLSVNFACALGASEQSVESLLDRLIEHEGVRVVDIELSDSELGILDRSTREVFRQIEDWEFQTRIGVPREVVNAINAKLQDNLL